MRWSDLSSYPGLLACYNPRERVIAVSSTMSSFSIAGNVDAVRDLRLAALLHECVHAFLCQLACKQCPMFNENVENAHGHGRAFQILLKALGGATEALLGSRLCCGGASDFVTNWTRVGCIPSVHDLQEWQWGEVRDSRGSWSWN